MNIRFFDHQARENVRLQSGIITYTPINRGETFKKQYRQWCGSQLQQYLLDKMKNEYESLFFGNKPQSIQIRRHNQHSSVVFSNLTNFQTSHHLFLMDYLVERLNTKGYQIFKSQQWKKLTDEGIEVQQRYILCQKMAWWKRFLPINRIKSDFVVLSTTLCEQQQALTFGITLLHNPKHNGTANIDALMEKIMKKI